jgi:hypothetical protein
MRVSASVTVRASVAPRHPRTGARPQRRALERHHDARKFLDRVHVGHSIDAGLDEDLIIPFAPTAQPTPQGGLPQWQTLTCRLSSHAPEAE